MFSSGRGECFERSLHDSLAPDVNPRTGGHLAVHCQPEPFEPIELGVIVPLSNEIRICDQNARRFIMGAKFSNGFAGLNQQRLIIFQFAE